MRHFIFALLGVSAISFLVGGITYSFETGNIASAIAGIYLAVVQTLTTAALLTAICKRPESCHHDDDEE